MNEIERVRQRLKERWGYLGCFEEVDGGIAIGHVPSEGDLYYLHRFYPSLSDEDVLALEEQMPVAVPEEFKAVLKICNGASVFQELSIFGYVSSIKRARIHPVGQPISLSYGNVDERVCAAGNNAFRIGALNGHNRGGYLYWQNGGEIELWSNFGVPELGKKWASFQEFLSTEVLRLQSLYNERGYFLGDAKNTLPPEIVHWDSID